MRFCDKHNEKASKTGNICLTTSLPPQLANHTPGFNLMHTIRQVCGSNFTPHRPSVNSNFTHHQPTHNHPNECNNKTAEPLHELGHVSSGAALRHMGVAALGLAAAGATEGPWGKSWAAAASLEKQVLVAMTNGGLDGGRVAAQCLMDASHGVQCGWVNLGVWLFVDQFVS